MDERDTGGLWVEIEPMRLEDIPEVQRIEGLSFPVRWPEDSFARELSDNGAARYLVARVEGRTVGYAGVWLVVDEAHITTLAVDPAWRGRGVGRRLFWHLMDTVVRQGARWATLEVNQTNQVAIRLYQEFGFSQVGLRKNYYEQREDAVVMWVGELQSADYRQRLQRLGAAWGLRSLSDGSLPGGRKRAGEFRPYL
ncbi:MAG TPA: ribosomal protein S18-alanine N-acetyltransferase [Candidatus Nitrosotenuis sp.]|jgi:ribosomal-protein-alanine N-acetyltransferase|nr:ribosomal protein S18-alanine N-acetyltransferase [Candidatus Nitrosotenuis sp.]